MSPLSGPRLESSRASKAQSPTLPYSCVLGAGQVSRGRAAARMARVRCMILALCAVAFFFLGLLAPQPAGVIKQFQQASQHRRQQVLSETMHSMQLLASVQGRGEAIADTPLTRDDLLLPIPTTAVRHALVHAGRGSWRQGIKTLVVTNVATTESYFNETEVWVPYPDAPSWGKGAGMSNSDGDARMVFAAVWANITFAEKFKWMLLGDDDTLFVIDNILRLLEGLDYNLPYIITDAVRPGYDWVGPDMHNTTLYPLGTAHGFCLLAMGEPDTPKGECVRWPKRSTSPCRAEDLSECAHLYEGGGCASNFYWGGGGAIVSIGLLRELSPTELMRCAADRSGGDWRISYCFCKHGYAISQVDPRRGSMSFYFKPPLDLIDVVDLEACPAGSRCELVRKNTCSVHLQAGGLNNPAVVSPANHDPAHIDRAIAAMRKIHDVFSRRIPTHPPSNSSSLAPSLTASSSPSAPSTPSGIESSTLNSTPKPPLLRVGNPTEEGKQALRDAANRVVGVYANRVEERLANTVVMLSGSMAYLDILYNWMCCARRLKDEFKFMVVTHDTPLHRLLSTNTSIVSVDGTALGNTPIPHFSEWNTPEFNYLNFMRVKALQVLLEMGYDVLLSDADTCWLEDPFPHLRSDVAMQVSTDRVMNRTNPAIEDLGEVFGPFEINAGFYYARSTPEVIQFFAEVQARCCTNMNDQIAMNQVMPQWMTEKRATQIPRGALNSSLSQSTERRTSFTVQYLDPALFPSGYNYFYQGHTAWQAHGVAANKTSVVVVHVTWTIGHPAKVDQLRRKNLWLVDASDSSKELVCSNATTIATPLA